MWETELQQLESLLLFIHSPPYTLHSPRVQVKRVVIHKDYKAPTFENDIAILELESPIERQPHVVPICMPGTDTGTGGEEGFLGRMGIVTGWGRLEYGEDTADPDPHIIPAQYVTSAPQFWFYQKISRFPLPIHI